MWLPKLITNPSAVVFDIGCNDGNDTANFCRQFPNGKIYAFEPDPRAIENFKKKNLPAVLFEGVVSDADGFVEFYQSDSDTGWDKSGSILPPKDLLTSHSWIKFDKKIYVKSITLDTFVRENNIPFIDFVWADVQGAEEKLIVGGMDTFTNKVQYFYTEYSIGELYQKATSFERIKELLPNYRVVNLYNTNEYGGDVLLINEGVK